MRQEKNSESIFIRTFDLPDIHFVGVSGLEADENMFSATRIPDVEELDSIALERWFEQSSDADENKSRRDCWLEIDGKIYIAWGTLILKRKLIEDGMIPLERWDFSFNEIRQYKPSSN